VTDLHLQVRRERAHLGFRPGFPQGVHTAIVSRVSIDGEIFAKIPTQDIRIEYGPLIAPEGFLPVIGTECLIAITPQPGGNWYVVPIPGGGGEPGPPGPEGPEGPEGPMGPVGPTGLTGPQGPIGLTGNTGPTGATGSQGPQGIQGVPGTPGATGATGAAGEVWFSGSGAPAGGLAGSIVGDWYLDSATGDFYEKTGTSAWTLRGNLKGPTGATGSTGSTGAPGTPGMAGAPGSVWRSGAGAPASGTGIVGDWYLNTINGDVYEKTGVSTWTLRDNLTGPQGATGSTGPAGTVSPGSWANVPGAANWVANAPGTDTPRMRRDSSGTVFLEGGLRNTAGFAFGGANSNIAILAAPYLPQMMQVFSGLINDVTNGVRPIYVQLYQNGMMYVGNAGAAGVTGGAGSVVYLYGHSYLAA
jgi:hypothetical protein